MQIVERSFSGRTILQVEGRLDLTSVPNLRKELLQRLGDSQEGDVFLLDLAGVPFMDSSGIATLIEARQVALQHGLFLRLFGLTEQVQQLFELAGIAAAFEIYPDVTAALSGEA